MPCVLVIQGGGFNARNGQRFCPFAVYLANHGLAAALASYRGRPKRELRDTISDLKTAVRFVRKNAKRHNIDADNIGAMGRSAGGTLAALLAVPGDIEILAGTLRCGQIGRQHRIFDACPSSCLLRRSV
ncbi:MAG: acetyl esterase/lipase [Pirellulaceae bacterium]